MGLSYDLISQFAKVTNDTTSKKKEVTVYGTIVKYSGATYVKLDGSDLLTPYTSTVAVEDGDRVLVTITNHEATVTGSTSNPSASNAQVEVIDEKVTQFNKIIADKITVEDLEAFNGYFENILAVSGKYEDLQAVTAEIERLRVKYAEMEYISAADAEILNAEIETIKNKFLESTSITTQDLEAINAQISNLSAYNANFTYVSAEILKVFKADIHDLNVNKVSTAELNATIARIETLETDKLDAKSAEMLYANIDFSNIKMAAIQHLFSESGIINDLIVKEGKITGELIGVTIKGDLIEGGTIVADKLVVKGEDGLFYKLNLEGLGKDALEEIKDNDFGGDGTVFENGLHGSTIIAHSITADRIQVTDLVAFGATIGGFKLTESSIYSGVKDSVLNTTRGIYLDKEGQFAVGDSSNFIRYYLDEEKRMYKLEISAGAIRLGATSKTVEETIQEIEEKVKDMKDELTTNLCIESSRGTVFKNNEASTVLSVVIYRGSDRITDMKTLKAIMGSSAYLQWKWRRINDEAYGIISSGDFHISDDGFTFTVTPDDIDTQVTFMCELIS